MKKLLLITLMMFSFSVSVFAINSTLHVKGGVQYPEAPDKAGLDSALTLNLGVDKYFTIGAETGFGRVKWEQKIGDKPFGPVPLTQNHDINLYTLPLLAVATVRLADMMDNYGFMPYATGAAGYSWTWYRETGNKDRFDGFTWQALAGVEIKLGADSNLSCLIEAGYRGTDLQDADDYELDMSGFVGRVGVSFPIEPTE